MTSTLCETLQLLKQELQAHKALLVAVSKTYPAPRLLEAYACGQRDFGENRVQELAEKAATLPTDINWHYIGHLQTNKVKYIAPFVHLIHAVDSWKLLTEINKRAQSHDRVIKVLLQFKIATEETKQGYDAAEIFDMLKAGEWKNLKQVEIAGVMGMASFTTDQEQVSTEFSRLKCYFDQLKTEFFADSAGFREISMGMSGDYPLALQHGSTMVRIGSKIFGQRG